MMRRTGGAGRERYRGEYAPRFEERGPGGGGQEQGRPEAPPSRHLWVGNLPPHTTQSMLLEQFLRFGDLENISFIPGRSFAFINFRKEEDAIYALKTLQGHMFSGLPLKIQFQKGDKLSTPSSEGRYSREERSSSEQAESFQQRDQRHLPFSPGRMFLDKSKGSNNEEPSEVLWIGFPAHLNVDKITLERAFSPFGEIGKITTFPGRSYAFVRFRSTAAACLAKETLQGRLFNNPRVSICFAKSDTGLSEHGKGLNNPKADSYGPNRSTGILQRDRKFETSVADLSIFPSTSFLETKRTRGDGEAVGFARSAPEELSTGPRPTLHTFEYPRYQGLGSERRMVEDHFEHHASPTMEKGVFHRDFSNERPRRGLFEDSQDLDHGVLHMAKKMKMDSFYERELPDYPFSDFEKERQHIGPQTIIPNLPERQTYNKSLESDFGSKDVPGSSNNLSYLNVECNNPWKNSDGFVPSSASLHTKVKHDNYIKFTPEPQPFPFEEWKWEGTIAKGGTPICRARCFPVGKALDFVLPEFLDCTARTGLDMLARHFYQASSSWVVFFVPESDSDIAFYNEFMHYLGEKHRAAVAKLGEKTTLFLVPPSDFSERVLKVPGKVSISGVVLRFQQPSPDVNPSQRPIEMIDSNVSLLRQLDSQRDLCDDKLHKMPVLSDMRSSNKVLDYFPSSDNFAPAFSAVQKTSVGLPYSGPLPPLEKEPDSHGEKTYEVIQQQNSRGSPSWSPPHVHVPSSGFRTLSSTSSGVAASISHLSKSSVEEPSDLLTPRRFMAENDSKFPQSSGTTQHPSTTHLPPLQPEHFAQLAAFLGQQKQPGTDLPVVSSGNQKQSTSAHKPNIHDHAATASSDIAPQLSQVQQLLQQTSSLPATSERGKIEQQSNHQMQNSTREDNETDPQKRLQATLQLAAALLQQIQQQSKTDN